MTEYCTYPACKCIVQTSTGNPEVECKLGLAPNPGMPKVYMLPTHPHADPLVQAKVMAVNSKRSGAMARVNRYLALTTVKASAEQTAYWTAVKDHLRNTGFD